MVSSSLTLDTVSLAIKNGWGATMATFTNATTSFTSEMTKAANFAQKVFKETSITETEGKYIIKGPFSSKFTFTWRDLLMISGIITSVIFATIAFFTGSIFTGIVYLIYTGLLCLGTYWLSEWTKHLSMEKMLELVRTGEIAAIKVLNVLSKHNIKVYEGFEGLYSEQVTEFKNVRTHTRTLKKLDTHLAENADQIRESIAALEHSAATLPTALKPLAAEVMKTLKQSETVRDATRQEVDRLATVRDATRQEVDRLATVRDRLSAQVEVMADHLAEQRGENVRLKREVDRLMGIRRHAHFTDSTAKVDGPHGTASATSSAKA